MRTACIRTSCAAICLLSWVRIATAAPFVNLDFEQSTVQPGDPVNVPAEAAFPGWTARVDGQMQTTVTHNAIGIGAPVVAIWDMPIQQAAIVLLEGEYMGYLERGADGRNSTLSQVGDVPSGTRSLRLLCDGQQGPPTVRMNGVEILMVFVSGIQAPHQRAIYGGDVSAFSNSTVELELRSRTDPVFAARQAFDAIEFSPTPIPEPGPPLLCLTYAASLLHRRRTVSTIDPRSRSATAR